VGLNRCQSLDNCLGLWRAGHYFDCFLRRRLALNIFPFPVTIAKLIGEFYNNRRSAANQCLRFASSFVFLMLRQYYWRCNLFSANRQSAANLKKSVKTSYWCSEFTALRLLVQGRRTASLLSAESNVAPVGTVGATLLLALCLFAKNSPINLAVLTGNGNMVRTR
jgi:hypothetical protein